MSVTRWQMHKACWLVMKQSSAYWKVCLFHEGKKTQYLQGCPYKNPFFSEGQPGRNMFVSSLFIHCLTNVWIRKYLGLSTLFSFLTRFWLVSDNCCLIDINVRMMSLGEQSVFYWTPLWMIGLYKQACGQDYTASCSSNEL